MTQPLLHYHSFHSLLFGSIDLRKACKACAQVHVPCLAGKLSPNHHDITMCMLKFSGEKTRIVRLRNQFLPWSHSNRIQGRLPENGLLLPDPWVEVSSTWPWVYWVNRRWCWCSGPEQCHGATYETYENNGGPHLSKHTETYRNSTIWCPVRPRGRQPLECKAPVQEPRDGIMDGKKGLFCQTDSEMKTSSLIFQFNFTPYLFTLQTRANSV